MKAGVDVYGVLGCSHLLMYSSNWLCWGHVGAVSPCGNAVVAHFEKSMQELEELQD
jgi:hypothetical protein